MALPTGGTPPVIRPARTTLLMLLGIALMLLAERLGDATKAESAVQQIEVALVTMRDGGYASAAASLISGKSKWPRSEL